MNDARWLLPEGIDEVLPPQAGRLERLRRELLDFYQTWGYELVFPPFIEFLDSLLTGTGQDLDLQTFKLTDQLSGRLMGVRADMTPQAARIDAHRLRRDVPTRLCYLGTVLHTRPNGLAGSRAPLQIGAELYGHAGVESDVEILCLMMQSLRRAGVEDVYLDLGHVGIYRTLARRAGLSDGQETALFDALQRKALPEIEQLLESFQVAVTHARYLRALGELNGDDEVLTAARQRLAGAGVDAEIDYLAAVATAVRRCLPGVPLHFDLAELRAYRYQTGLVFAAFVPGRGEEVARGGRYDGIGRAFGRARPATGFSTDLKMLMRVGGGEQVAALPAVFAPWVGDDRLERRVAELRASGRVVIRELPGSPAAAGELGCGEQLTQQDRDWVLAPV